MSDGAPREYPDRPFVGVGMVCLKGDEVLLIRRAKPPVRSVWSIPGGAQELGETVREAGLRELMEETGIDAEIIGLIDVIDSITRDDDDRIRLHYTLVDFAAVWKAGEPKADSDAADAKWAPLDSLDGLGLWSRTLEVIREAERMRNGG